MGVDWHPKLFRRVHAAHGGSEEGEEDLEWIINAHLDTKDPKELVDRILSIAPILPGQGSFDQREAVKPRRSAEFSHPTSGGGHSQKPARAPENLIDFDSKPPTTAPPAQRDPMAGNAMHTTSNLQQTPVHQSTTINAPSGNAPKSANLMDDDGGLNDQMSRLKTHEAMQPEGQKPLKRADTDTNEVDVFVDAEG